MKKLLLFVFLLLNIIFLINVSEAFSISPGGVKLDFEPNLHYNDTVCVVKGSPTYVNFDFRGSNNLNKYININKKLGYYDGENKLCFDYSLDLPSALDKPGDNIIYLLASTTSNPSESKGTNLNIGMGILYLIKIKVPYPGKYIEASIKADPVGVGEPVNFVVNVENLGEDDLSSISGSLKILDPDGSIVTNIPLSGSISLASKEAGELKASWSGENSRVGIYKVIANLNYDSGNVATAESEFKVGDILVEITSVEVPPIEIGDTERVKIIAQSFWNDQIENVYSEVKVNGRAGRSPSINLEPWGSGRMIVFVDTKGIDETGIYNATAVVYYENKTATKYFNIKIINTMKTYMIIGGGVAGVIGMIVVAVFLIHKSRKSREDHIDRRINYYSQYYGNRR